MKDKMLSKILLAIIVSVISILIVLFTKSHKDESTSPFTPRPDMDQYFLHNTDKITMIIQVANITETDVVIEVSQD